MRTKNLKPEISSGDNLLCDTLIYNVFLLRQKHIYKLVLSTYFIGATILTWNFFTSILYLIYNILNSSPQQSAKPGDSLGQNKDITHHPWLFP